MNASISPVKLACLIGAPNGPTLIDVRADEDFSADPRLIPGDCFALLRLLLTLHEIAFPQADRRGSAGSFLR